MDTFLYFDYPSYESSSHILMESDHSFPFLCHKASVPVTFLWYNTCFLQFHEPSPTGPAFTIFSWSLQLKVYLLFARMLFFYTKKKKKKKKLTGDEIGSRSKTLNSWGSSFFMYLQQWQTGAPLPLCLSLAYSNFCFFMLLCLRRYIVVFSIGPSVLWLFISHLFFIFSYMCLFRVLFRICLTSTG